MSTSRIESSPPLDSNVINMPVRPQEDYIKNPGRLLDDGVMFAQGLLKTGQARINEYLIKGEQSAITAYLGAFVARDNLLLVAIPGSGKSEILRNGYNVIGGINSVANVPYRTDLTPTELTGKKQTLVKDTKIAGTPDVHEETTGLIVPILSPHNQVITQDEANRGNERTNQSMLDITGSRKIETADGLVDMYDLEAVILAMNPNESLRNTTPMTAARAARQAWGAIMGQESEWDSIFQARLYKDWTPVPEKIEPVIELPQLHVAQAAVKHVIIDDTVAPYIERVTRQSLAHMKQELDVHESVGRVLTQLMHSSRTLALMRGRKATVKDDVNDAIKNKLTAMLAGNCKLELDAIKPFVNGVVNSSN